MSDSTSVVLCSNCYTELLAWYDKKIYSMAYEPEMKRFRPRSPDEMVREYEAAYRAFAEYKRGQ